MRLWRVSDFIPKVYGDCKTRLFTVVTQITWRRKKKTETEVEEEGEKKGLAEYQ
jgi:hypothetical protein